MKKTVITLLLLLVVGSLFGQTKKWGKFVYLDDEEVYPQEGTKEAELFSEYWSDKFCLIKEEKNILGETQDVYSIVGKIGSINYLYGTSYIITRNQTSELLKKFNGTPDIYKMITHIKIFMILVMKNPKQKKN